MSVATNPFVDMLWAVLFSCLWVVWLALLFRVIGGHLPASRSLRPGQDGLERPRDLANIQQSPSIPSSVKSQAQVELAGGVAFISDADLEAALDEANVDPATSDAALEAYGEAARVDGLRAALAIPAVLALSALFFAQRIPTTQPGTKER
jgi:hypothetical protein